MQLKTNVQAEDGGNHIAITRVFDLPVELLFLAHEDPEIFAQWMSNPYAKARVIKYEARKHGGFQLESVNSDGQIVFSSNGVFHDFVRNEKITRTFEMENTPFPPQLEFLTFEKLDSNTSKLTAFIVFKSIEHRNELLKMPFAQGISMAHDRLQDVMTERGR